MSCGSHIWCQVGFFQPHMASSQLHTLNSISFCYTIFIMTHYDLVITEPVPNVIIVTNVLRTMMLALNFAVNLRCLYFQAPWHHRHYHKLHCRTMVLPSLSSHSDTTSIMWTEDINFKSHHVTQFSPFSMLFFPGYSLFYSNITLVTCPTCNKPCQIYGLTGLITVLYDYTGQYCKNMSTANLLSQPQWSSFY